ncbi:MAG: hypothetical protein Alpg2KO_11190 [Alphaproteobacteria bacterium]
MTRLLATLVIALTFMLSPQAPALAQSQSAAEASADTWLAWVRTGDSELDRVSSLGLEGLARALYTRSSVEPPGAVGVDITRDDLSLYPFLYWPLGENQQDLSDYVAEKLNRYMRNGGTIFFDTRDARYGGDGPGGAALRRIARKLDIPPLQEVPDDHVLTKSFYLLQSFPGRYQGAELWIADAASTQNDGVTPIMIGSGDYAGAWAVTRAGRPAYPVSSGRPRQRELAYRFGVNLVMHILTGSYKSDQVHIPAIMERLGQ